MQDSDLLYQLDAAVLDAHSQRKSAENFASSIKKFIAYVEENQNSTCSLIHLCKEFHFQRRRFYDVINVLEALNFCKKTGVDEMVWYGRANFKKMLLQIKKSSIKEENTFDQCISISVLTVRFIKSFFTFNSQTINIKDIGNYLSRENGRTKTTTCKLYQIAHILEAASVVEKTIMPGEIRLPEEYFKIEESQPRIPFTIEQLLNTPAPIKPMQQESDLLDVDVLASHVAA